MSTESPPTRERILQESLTLFSQRGYEAVTVAEIADAVGIKAPSLYKHYTSKRAIFEALLVEVESRYEKQAAAMQVHGREAEPDKDFYLHVSENQLVEIGLGLFTHFLHDEFESKFRKMLQIERYANPMLADLYVQRYIDAPITYQSRLFALLIEEGLFVQADPHIMAMHFYTPILVLLILCDCHPNREAEAQATLETHIRQFSKRYKNGVPE